MEKLEILKEIMEGVSNQAPLIHCITNPISIHDCANAVLATGARPMMAEHPEEVREITAGARALALNLGNITDARIRSIKISGMEAVRRGIPTVLDLVGIGCSALRKNLALEFLEMRQKEGGHPLILKGNLSELKALWAVGSGQEVFTDGVDVRSQDVMDRENERETVKFLQTLAERYGAVILATGKTDVAADEKQVFLADNGCERMSRITGTGCMVTVLAASFASQGNLLQAALLAAVFSGVCGELAAVDWKGTGTFQARLMDEFSQCTWEKIRKYGKIRT